MADPYSIILGNNEISNCDAALIIEGEEVLRLREDEHGALLIDCDIRNQAGRIAKIARNFPAYVAPGFRAKIAPGQPAEVVHEATGQVLARFERLGPRRIKVAGSFCVNGFLVVADDAGVFAGGITMSMNTIRGFGTAIKLGRGAVAIGCV
jgi:hypothetical protein